MGGGEREGRGGSREEKVGREAVSKCENFGRYDKRERGNEEKEEREE